MLHVELGPMLESAHDHHRAGRLTQAELLYREILRQQPDHPDVLHKLGLLAHQTGHSAAGEQLLRRALALRPNDPHMMDTLAACLFGLQRYPEAIDLLRAVIRIAPHYANAYYNLGTALQTDQQLDEAAQVLRQARGLLPGDPMVGNNLAHVLAMQGDLDGAIVEFRSVLAAHPEHPVVHSNLIYHMALHPAHDGRRILQECREWNRRHARPLMQSAAGLSDRDPERPLRIGYVSPDFRDHVVGRNLLPLFRHTDGRDTQAICFYNGTAADAVTEEYRRLAAEFHPIAPLSDEQAAELIRGRRIDILVDLALHTAGNRLLVLARRPAPVQATFAGYPGTTGVEAIDYRLSDPYLDPPGADDAIYSEITVRLATTYMCLEPPLEAPPVSELPRLACGQVTFACLNSLNRVPPGALQAFAGVLRAVPGSRLMLRAPEGSARSRILELMGRAGNEGQRIVFQPTLPRSQYLALYQQIDIALDTRPYNGYASSLEAMYMGVPVVTLAGATGVGRAGASLLHNLGVPELIAHSETEFVEIACRLALDPGRLAALRGDLRPRLAASPLMDGPRYARDVNAAWRIMWRRWCDMII